ncbi:NACHT domain-containing protein [Brasilonema bromeliae]|uniref:NACHT domain-containing protein n=1 Tax=Brasilonema bromeliae TaxID=383615 RepID=UPI00145DABA0
MRRETLCEDIRIDIGNISYESGLSRNEFAKKLINKLFRNKLEESLCRLCEILEEDFPQGDYSDDLRSIQKKLNRDPDRETLLNRVQKTKVQPFLEPKGLISNPEELNNKVIPLGLEERPTGTKVFDIFDNEMDDKRTLLILGEPGSGKTTILADLTNELIERAREDKNHPIPIILNLSSWKEKQTIDEWIVEQLKDFYQVPKEKGWNFVQQKQLLLLIDGFDELKSVSQKSCVRELNKFITTYDSTRIVVCSRTDEDNENEEREELLQELTSQIVVRLKPLDLEKAVQYLNDNSVPDWLKELVNTNNQLQILIKLPLFLYLIIEVYKSDKNSQQKTDFLQEDSEDEIWNKIFYKYIEKQLEKWKSNPNYSEKVNKEEVNRYLKWLAKQMHKENQTDFLIEKMQPKWLSQPSNQVTFQETIYHIGVSLIVGLLCGLASGLFSEILNYNSNPQDQIPWIHYIFFGLISGLLSGFISGLIFLLPEDLEYNPISKLKSALRKSTRRRSALIGYPLRLLSKLTYWLRANRNSKLTSRFRFVMIGLISGLIRWEVNLRLEEGKTQPLDAIIFGLISGFIVGEMKTLWL